MYGVNPMLINGSDRIHIDLVGFLTKQYPTYNALFWNGMWETGNVDKSWPWLGSTTITRDTLMTLDYIISMEGGTDVW